MGEFLMERQISGKGKRHGQGFKIGGYALVATVQNAHAPVTIAAGFARITRI
jgi:hypothetical protein